MTAEEVSIDSLYLFNRLCNCHTLVRILDSDLHLLFSFIIIVFEAGATLSSLLLSS